MHYSRRGSDPVFVDRTGRRRRLFAIAGSAGGLVLVLVVAALLAGFTGDGPASIPGWPTSGGHAKTTTSRPPTPDPDAATTGTPRPVAEPTIGVTPTTTPAGTPKPTTAAPVATTVTPTLTPSSRRRNSSHTPQPHPTKTH